VESGIKLGSKENMIKDDIPEPSFLDISRKIVLDSEDDIDLNLDEALIHSEIEVPINKIPETIVVTLIWRYLKNVSKI